MIPLCLIIGDSTAVGTANALVAQGIRCAVYAREGAPSAESVRNLRAGIPADRSLIALGSNDPTNPGLARNLMIVRQRTAGARVTWLAPYHAGAAKIVNEIARTFGDTVIQLSAVPSRDRVHPNSYRVVAAALQWQTPGLARWRYPSVRPSPIAPRGLAISPREAPIRQAVVLSF